MEPPITELNSCHRLMLYNLYSHTHRNSLIQAIFFCRKISCFRVSMVRSLVAQLINLMLHLPNQWKLKFHSWYKMIIVPFTKPSITHSSMSYLNYFETKLEQKPHYQISQRWVGQHGQHKYASTDLCDWSMLCGLSGEDYNSFQWCRRIEQLCIWMTNPE